MKRLNGMDAMLLYSEAPNLHTHTLKVAVIDPADVPGSGSRRVSLAGAPRGAEQDDERGRVQRGRTA